MVLHRWFGDAGRPAVSGVIAGAPNVWGLTVARDDWRQAAEDMAVHGGRLLSLWASRDVQGGDVVHAAFVADRGVLVLSLTLNDADAGYPGIEGWFPSACRMQRAAADLSGLRTTAADTRPWLRHSAWPENFHPLIHADTPPMSAEDAVDNYAFLPVEGDGVHEIPVGPVHAGIIEPGHFRFSVVERRFSDWKSVWATLTRVLNGVSQIFHCSAVSGWRRACPVTQPLHFRGLIARRSREWSLRACPRGQSGYGRWRWSWSVYRIIWVILARSPTMPALPLDLPSSPGSRNDCCAQTSKHSDNATSWISSCREARASICDRPERPH